MNSEKTSVNWYAHGARYYDPQLARWHATDPLSELYASSSPYGYVINNPINFVDPDGMRRDPLPWGQEYNTRFLTDGERRLRADADSWNNVGRCMSNPGPGVPYTDESGNIYETGQDPVTGEKYYTVEYVKDWYDTNTGDYMYTTPDGSKRVPIASNGGGLPKDGVHFFNDKGEKIGQLEVGTNWPFEIRYVRASNIEGFKQAMKYTNRYGHRSSADRWNSAMYYSTQAELSIVDGQYSMSLNKDWEYWSRTIGEMIVKAYGQDFRTGPLGPDPVGDAFNSGYNWRVYHGIPIHF